MSSAEFKAKAYVKEGCPFSFKFLVFMAEAGLLDRIEIVRMKPQDPGFEAEKEKLSKRIGKALTFPTVEVEPGQYQTDSDKLIDRYAAEAGLTPDEQPVLSFYKQTIFPQLIELFQIKHPQTAKSAEARSPAANCQANPGACVGAVRLRVNRTSIVRRRFRELGTCLALHAPLRVTSLRKRHHIQIPPRRDFAR